MSFKISDETKEKVIDEAWKAAGVPLRLAPTIFGAIGAGAMIADVVDSHPSFKEKLSGLEGKIFLFEATDINKRFFLVVKNRTIDVLLHCTKPHDVVMRGSVRVLFELFLGKVDPDTVFFSRRLEINGDTAAAILLKNLLAGL